MPIALREDHRHFERVSNESFRRKVVREGWRRSARAVTVCLQPSGCARGFVTGYVPVLERRVGKDGRDDGSEAIAEQELFSEVCNGAVIEIGLRGASARHHVP